ncbi:MAG: calcium/sodium antiporter [Myxococcota bacterium]|nr:calcium/sodium antiporter [Myxococcota bacterium]
MFVDFLQLAAGLTILVAGGELMVRGASSLARRLGISNLIIGLTVVAFGTSAPELAVNIGAALNNAGSLAFGNIFGSNMANIGLIIALVAILQPIPIQNILIHRELPMLILATAAALVMAFDSELGGERNAYMRTDGIVLLFFFVIFLYYTISDLLHRGQTGAERADNDGAPLIEIPEDEDHKPGGGLGRDILLTLLGLVGLVGGAKLTVEGAVGLAYAFAVPEVVIGLTMVSLGTSLPELAAAMSCLRHGKADMAVGSVIGSNIFNTLLVAGVTATVHPMMIPPSGTVDLVATCVMSLLFALTAYTRGNVIIRAEGVLLMVVYVTYLVWRTIYYATS